MVAKRWQQAYLGAVPMPSSSVSWEQRKNMMCSNCSSWPLPQQSKILSFHGLEDVVPLFPEMSKILLQKRKKNPIFWSSQLGKKKIRKEQKERMLCQQIESCVWQRVKLAVLSDTIWITDFKEIPCKSFEAESKCHSGYYLALHNSSSFSII